MCYILYIVLRASWKISLLAKCCHPHKIKSLLTYLLTYYYMCVHTIFMTSLEKSTVKILTIGAAKSEQTLQKQIRARLFKTNDVVS